MNTLIIVSCVLSALAVILIVLFRPKANDNGTVLANKLDDLFKRFDLITTNLREDFKANREENSDNASKNRQELTETLNGFRKEMLDTLHLITEQNKSGADQINRTLDEKINALIEKVDQNNKENRQTITTTLKDFSSEQGAKIEEFKQQLNQTSVKTIEQLERITAKVEEKLTQVNEQARADNTLVRQALETSIKSFGERFSGSVKDMNDLQRERFGQLEEKQSQLINKTEEKLTIINNQAKADNTQMRGSLETAFKGFQETFDKNVTSFNNLQREKFGQLEEKQNKLVEATEKKLDGIREAVEEKLQKTLQERLGQSFDVVTKQLAAVQQGLGEMQTLAQDVGGLKKVLSNVKMRGGFGEVQLHMLLENILAPEQYEANVATKKGSADRVEFAVKFPNKENDREYVWLPIDAKFPKDAYENLQNAYEVGDTTLVDAAQKALELVIKKMAKDICDKYIDSPDTTNFGIMFLPFEGLFAEVVRKSSLLEEIQRDYHVVITGPTTLAVILNSLQMGFRTLAIQKRSSEVWQILSAVKKEFSLFGGLLEKATNNIQTGLNQLDDVVGKRTRAIQRKLKGVEVLNGEEKNGSQLSLPAEVLEEEEE
jgi:DNA recombination protein RmuC